MVAGALEQSEALLKERFDFIMFTGSPVIGKIVMKEAAATLTPVLLELGGKRCSGRGGLICSVLVPI